MPGEGKRTGRQPASAMYSRRLGQAPAGLSFIYLSAVSWEVRRGEKAEASLYQRGLARFWGIGNIIGLLSLLAMAPIRHFSLPLPSTPVAHRYSWGDEAELAFRALSGDNHKQDLSLVLTVAFIWSGEVFLHSLPSAIAFAFCRCLSLSGLSRNAGNLIAAWLGLHMTTAVQGKWLCCEGQATC